MLDNVSGVCISEDGQSIKFMEGQIEWIACPSLDGRGGWKVSAYHHIFFGFGQNIWAAIDDAKRMSAFGMGDRRRKDPGLRRRKSDV